MILVDTSVLIDLFKGRENEITRRFRSIPTTATGAVWHYVGYLPRDPARGKN